MALPVPYQPKDEVALIFVQLKESQSQSAQKDA